MAYRGTRFTTAGTAQANKFLAPDANLDVAGLRNVGLSGLSPDKGTATATAGAATLNKMAGTITSEALTTAAGADYVLTLTNSVVTANSLVFASVAHGTNTTEGLAVQRITPAAGSVVIRVRNTHASAALNGTIKISFLVVG